MNTEDGRDITVNSKTSSSADDKRIDEARKELARVINMLEGIVDKVKWACERQEWDDGVVYQIEDGVQRLGYALATLTTWYEALDGEYNN